MPQMVVTKERIVSDLKGLGLHAGDLVLMHSALSSMGQVAGGAETVIRTVLEVLGPQGTLVMPTFGSPEPFDLKNTPSHLGAITEAFRKFPGAVRSLHPTQSVAAMGPRAQEMIRDHLANPTATGRNTPFGRLIALGGKILLLGVDNDRNTTMHTLEEYAGAVYLSDHQAAYVDANGRPRILHLKSYPGTHRNFIGVDRLLRETGAAVVGKVGSAVCRLIDAARMHDVLLEAFRGDPALVLCTNPACADCVAQRTRIRLHQLKEETFILSASASAISPYPDEIVAELGRAGVGDLIVDRLFGRPVWKVEEKLLRRAARTFAEEGLTVAAVAGPADPTGLDRISTLATTFGTGTVVVPLVGEIPAILDGAGRHGINVFFENGPITSFFAMSLLKRANAGRVLAFNPAAFAMMGEKPSQWTFTRGGLKRHLGMLLLSDATFAGHFTLPGQGNGEVKELLSLLRCRGFDGRVVLTTGPGGPAFRELVEGFWTLVETM